MNNAKNASLLKNRMEKSKISADDLARALKVTTQTIYNLRRGVGSEQLYDHAFIVLKGLEATQ